jgi:hypothetical protein
MPRFVTWRLLRELGGAPRAPRRLAPRKLPQRAPERTPAAAAGAGGLLP